MPKKSTDEVVGNLKKSHEYQEKLNDYRCGSYHIAYVNMGEFLKAKDLAIDIFFINVVEKTFFKRKEEKERGPLKDTHTTTPRLNHDPLIIDDSSYASSAQILSLKQPTTKL